MLTRSRELATLARLVLLKLAQTCMNRTASATYRYCLREIKRLPKESQSYYQEYARGNFVAHLKETDAKESARLTAHALDTAVPYVLQKFELLPLPENAAHWAPAAEEAGGAEAEGAVVEEWKP